MKGAVRSVRQASPGPFPTPDPFLFCVYHRDRYPAGDGKLQLPNGERGNGADFDPSKPYRTYHGERVPGFPKHPHRGFETITATLDGLIDHADSLGNAGRYGHGDLQWMTASAGVQHCEMFPLVNTAAANPTRFFQIWLNLPAGSKFADPDFVMHWGPDIKRWASEDGGARATVWAGRFFGREALAPPSRSWAADPDHDVGILHISLDAGAAMEVPAAAGGESTQRTLYLIEGRRAKVGGEAVERTGVAAVVEVDAGGAVAVEAEGEPVEFLMLQGRPIAEPVAQHGPFVMNSWDQIRDAFSDYRRTQFGGWPWPRDDMVFPPDQQRFAKVHGKTIYPPASSGADADAAGDA